MSHALEDCEFTSAEYFDECQECGPLSACVCLASIVKEWTIARLSFPLSFAPNATHYYEFTPHNSDLPVAYYGVAESYRQAMDAIAHAANCGRGRE